MRRISALAIVLLITLIRGQSAHAELVPLRVAGGILFVPVLVNDKIVLSFTIDSAATDVSIPLDVFSALVGAGTITDKDKMDTQQYRLADGSERSSQRFVIRSLRVGGVEIRNVIGSVAPEEGDLLLGQSFLSKLSSWSIDNDRHLLLLNESQKAAEAPPAPAGMLSTPTVMSTKPDDVFQRTVAYLLTGDELGEIKILNRRNCVIETRHRIWPNAPDLVEVIHLNNVDRARSSIRSFSDVPKNRVDITLSGERVVDYLARPAYKAGKLEGPGEPAHSSSEDTISLYTDEYARVLRAWEYIYSHGCKGLSGASRN